MKYLAVPLKKYLKDLGSQLPAPGGGSASGLTAALGVSLLLMVVNFSAGKQVSREIKKTMAVLMKHLSSLGEELAGSIDDDVRAYSRLSRAIKLPRNSPERAQVLQAALKSAAEVPFRICEISCIASKTLEVLLDKGNKNLLTDVGCSATFLQSAFDAGRLNAEINLKYIKDTRFTRNMSRRLNIWGKTVVVTCNRTLKSVQKQI